jgi:DUF3043 family protein
VARTPKTDGDDASISEPPVEAPVAKGRPTPTRKEQEAARKQPLVPSDRRLAARQYARDFVDARFSIGEVLLPVLVVVILTYFLPPQYSSIALIAVWLVLLVVVADGIWMGQRIIGKLSEKYGKDKVERGIRWYSFMRAIQLRPMRLPKPQVKRGQYPS